MLVYCGQTVGYIKIKLGTVVGLDPGHIVFDVVDHAILLGKLQTLATISLLLIGLFHFCLTIIKYVKLIDLILYHFQLTKVSSTVQG